MTDDKLIEEMFLAIIRVTPNQEQILANIPPRRILEFRIAAETALSVARPAIRKEAFEEAATVAHEMAAEPVSKYPSDQSRAIAAAIRALE